MKIIYISPLNAYLHKNTIITYFIQFKKFISKDIICGGD